MQFCQTMQDKMSFPTLKLHKGVIILDSLLLTASVKFMAESKMAAIFVAWVYISGQKSKDLESEKPQIKKGISAFV